MPDITKSFLGKRFIQIKRDKDSLEIEEENFTEGFRFHSADNG